MEQLASGSAQLPGAHDASTVSLQAFQDLVGNFTELKARVEANFQKDHRAAVDMSAGWLILCGEPPKMCAHWIIFAADSHKPHAVRRCVSLFHANRVRYVGDGGGFQIECNQRTIQGTAHASDHVGLIATTMQPQHEYVSVLTVQSLNGPVGYSCGA